MAGASKRPRKTAGKTAAGSATAPRKRSPTPAKTKTAAKKRARKTAEKSTADRPAQIAPVGPASPPPAPPGPSAARAWVAPALPQQRRAGYVLIVLSAAGIAGIGAWIATESLHGMEHWAARAALRGVCVALIGVALWLILSRRTAVSRLLILGASALVLLLVETGSAWWVGRLRAVAERTLPQLEAGRRDIESLTPVEMADPYIEAYVVMRDIYWELYARSDDEMSRYRSYYEDYTAEGAFLDVERLATTAALRRSINQIEDLHRRLSRVEAARPDISDLLLTVSLLDVDAVTRAAYENDLRAARDAFVDATIESVARERETLRTMRDALEALIGAQGRYRIENGRIIFDHPEDATRFVGIAEEAD